MGKIKKRGWINIHKGGENRTVSGIFESKEKAEEWMKTFFGPSPQTISTTIEIEWEEEV